MPSAIDIFTKFVNSPGGVLTAGAVLAGIVWKCFGMFDAVLAENAKLWIAVWLLDIKIVPPEVPQSVFLNLFWAVCGKRGSYKREWVTCMLAFTNEIMGTVQIESLHVPAWKWAAEIIYFVISLTLISLIVEANERYLVQTTNVRSLLPSILAIMTAVTAGVVAMATWQGIPFSNMLRLPHLGIVIGRLSVVPAFIAGIWMWLPVVSGFLLIAARRFNIGFEWFSRTFDIEKHPLQSIGLVAGAIVAVVYWTAVGISRVL
jgi:hypothetical protein